MLRVMVVTQILESLVGQYANSSASGEVLCWKSLNRFPGKLYLLCCAYFTALLQHTALAYLLRFNYLTYLRETKIPFDLDI